MRNVFLKVNQGLKRLMYTTVYCYSTIEFFKFKNKGNMRLSEKSNIYTKDYMINKINFDELKEHTNKIIHCLDVIENKERINFKTNGKDECSKLKKIQNNIKIYRHINKLYKQIRKVTKLLRGYMNILEYNIMEKKYQIDDTEIDFNKIIDVVKQIEQVKANCYFSKNDLAYIMNFLFNEYEEILLRFISDMISFNKNSNDTKITPDNIDFILRLCQSILSETSATTNESKIYFAKRILINYYADKGYFYSDSILEINQKSNYSDLMNDKKVKTNEDYFDYDIVFVCGLNVLFFIYFIG